MKVVCPLCDHVYFSVLRRCPECGQNNDACTSKFVMFQTEVDEAVLVTFRELAKGLEAECLQEALEEWITARSKKK